MKILGVDVGGSGIKGAIVETSTGEMLTERHRITTPQPATPQAVAETILQLVEYFDEWQGPIGCGFPAAIVHGVAKTAANLDNAFIDTNVEALFGEITGCEVYCLNDADAVGMAEFTLGAGKGNGGTVIFITIGTGLGTAIYTNGHLLPNTELGHIYLPNGVEGEVWASDAARKREDLKWKKWALRFNEYLRTMEGLFWPDLFILGGGASKKLDRFSEYLNIKTPFVQASMLNDAGIVGAAIYAETEVNNLSSG